MAFPQTKTYTLEEFEDFIRRPENRDRHFELIHGAIVEKAMPTDEHSLIVNWLLFSLTGYSVIHGLRPPGPERRFRFPDDTQNARQPDVSQILDPNVPLVIQGPMEIIPDVIAEVMSPDDSIDDLREKAKFYIASGVRLVWLVFPRQKIVEVYRPQQPSDMLTVSDTLDGYDVLPGFSLPIAELFATTRRG
jgi:Uma2 family endonuclease